jgi:caffeoyl-CoA O-methyltransferase
MCRGAGQATIGDMSDLGPAGVKHVPMSQALRGYLVRSSTPPDPVVRSLVERTASTGEAAGMMVPVEQAALLTMLARILSARVAIDVGTFTGISALALARGVAPDGRVITCDITDQWAELAREHWQSAGVADRIEFRLGPAGRTLDSLAPELGADIVFVDADKLNYPSYYRSAVPLLRRGGLLILDNVLLDGYVLAPELAEEKLLHRCAGTMRELNTAIAADDRLEVVMLPIADGLTIARKR